VNTLVAEILDPRTENLLALAQLDDFLGASDLVSMALGQTAKESDIHGLLEVIFSPEGDEMHIKDIRLYAKEGELLTWWEITARARMRSEVALGFLKPDICDKPILNPGNESQADMMPMPDYSKKTPLVWKYPDKLIVLSVAADTFGLIILRHRIQQRASVVGISGQSVCMFTITKFYVAMDCPHARLADLGLWGVKVLDWVSLVLILDVARCVFAKYRATYQEDTDILKAKWIVACNAIAAIAYQPAPYELQKAFELYLDTFSALPQVVMMVRQSDNVEAPIAHFLAATSMSRITDFFEWCNRFHFWDHPLHMQFSHIVILFCHAAYVLTVLDFLYLYSKTYFNHSLTTDVILDEHLV